LQKSANLLSSIHGHFAGLDAHGGLRLLGTLKITFMIQISTLKKLLCLTPSLLLLSAYSVFAKPDDIEGKVVNYGIFTFAPKEMAIKSPETPSGVTRVTVGTPILVSATNRIPAKISIRFGMAYDVDHLPVPDGVVGITKIARHSAITKPDGAKSTEFTTIERQFVKGGHVTG
jgi:hypothetical protein